MLYRFAPVSLLAVLVLAVGIWLAAVRPVLAEEGEGKAGLAEMLGEQHVAIIHFPIALAVAAALAEVLALITRRPAFAHAARFCIVIAALGAIAAVITGWFQFAEISGESGEGPIARELLIHRALGISAALVIVATAVLSELGRIRRNTWVLLAYRLALLAAVVLVVFTGYYGGKYVFG